MSINIKTRLKRLEIFFECDELSEKIKAEKWEKTLEERRHLSDKPLSRNPTPTETSTVLDRLLGIIRD